MSGPPRVRSMNISEPESRPVLGPTGNKSRQADTRKPGSKPLKKPENLLQAAETKDKRVSSSPPSPLPQNVIVPLVRQQERHHFPLNLSMNASCSSDASSDSSSRSRASRGRIVRRGGLAVRRRQCGSKMVERGAEKDKVGGDSVVGDSVDCSDAKKSCAWVTANTDPCYAAFHDEEWGVRANDDKKLFELLSLSGALAELTWPTILNKRHLFSETFVGFDPSAVSKLNEKKMTAPGSPANSLLSELKVRSIIENARQMCKIIDEFGSFHTYIWNFVNHKPIVNQFRYPRQVPVKTPKAEVISKDLVRRGFRSVGPTVIYAFMQVAGLTNDHLISCFRYQECMAIAESGEDSSIKSTVEEELLDPANLSLERAVVELNLLIPSK